MFIFSGEEGDVYIGEAREGWPLLTVETEANRDSRSTYERGPSLVGSLDSSTRDFCPALAAVVGPVKNISFLTLHYFTSFVPIAQQAGQAVVPRRLSLNMCLWFTLFKTARGIYSKFSRQIDEFSFFSTARNVHISGEQCLFSFCKTTRTARY